MASLDHIAFRAAESVAIGAEQTVGQQVMVTHATTTEMMSMGNEAVRPTRASAEMLDSGWWRCGCDVDCNCGRPDVLVKRLNSPELSKCIRCGAYQPAKEEQMRAAEAKRAEQREVKRLKMKQRRG